MESREEHLELEARLKDLSARAERGSLAVSSFLSPKEVREAERYLHKAGVAFQSYGGYASAERQRIYVLPEYMEYLADSTESFLEGLTAWDTDAEICALKVCGSGYRVLSHRDFLGSLLALGIERSVIGDVLMTENEGREALVLCDERIAEYLLQVWERVGNDKIHIQRIVLPQSFSPQRRFATLTDTVASPRLDGIVASICRLSREKAKELVQSGMVEVDYEGEEHPDRVLNAPCLVSVRGHGKFRIVSVADQTKKGRFRLIAEKYL